MSLSCFFIYLFFIIIIIFLQGLLYSYNITNMRKMFISRQYLHSVLFLSTMLWAMHTMGKGPASVRTVMYITSKPQLIFHLTSIVYSRPEAW